MLLKRIRQAKRDESGFTLIELLIVIVILGVLAAVVVFAVGGINDRGTESACKSDVATLTVASEAYYAQNGNYAKNVEALVDADLIRSAPTGDGYEVAYSDDGSVTGTLDDSGKAC